MLSAYRGHHTRIVVRQTIDERIAPTTLIARYPNFMPHIGVEPGDAPKVLLFIPSSQWSRSEIRDFGLCHHIPVELPEEAHCLAPARRLVVSWDGKITQCAHDIQLRNMLNDDARLVEVWKDRHRYIREAERTNTPERPFCTDCSFVHSCTGPNGT
jgi:radical SAM protein with 4Fe4S-binding SPASM domain